MKYLIVLPILLSVFAIIITVYDKFASKHIKSGRVSEKFLFLTAILGGGTAMYLTMKIIRHKTRHKQFMIGLPIIILFHAVILVTLIMREF